MSFSSVQLWNDSTVWDQYLKNIEVILGDRLTRLDEKDPTRRRADVENGEGVYITNFDDLQGSRWLFGEFAKTKINLMLVLNKNYINSLGRSVYNYINFYIPIPENPSVSELARLIQFFELTVENLKVFYAYSDFKEEILTKKSCGGGAIDIATELPGIFWLTYLCPKYCEFFNHHTISSLRGAQKGSGGGMTIRLAESPFQVGPNDRRDAETTLGKKYFAGLEPITDFNKRKAYGQLLTLEQLRC